MYARGPSLTMLNPGPFLITWSPAYLPVLEARSGARICTSIRLPDEPGGTAVVERREEERLDAERTEGRSEGVTRDRVPLLAEGTEYLLPDRVLDHVRDEGVRDRVP